MSANYIILPTTAEPYQAIYLPASPDGHAFQAKIELRWLAAPGYWFLSIFDTITGALYVNQIPVICSYETINDLLIPFQYLFRGSGIGSLFCVKATDQPKTVDPRKDNLSEFYIIWGDRWTGLSDG